MAWSRCIIWALCTGFLGLMYPVASSGQTNRYMVHFTDKNGSPFSVAEPERFLSSAAVDRRNQQGISISTEDLPVNPGYIDLVEATGSRTFFSSKWFNAVLIESDVSLIADISALSFVSSVEYVAPGDMKTISKGRKRMSSGLRMGKTEKSLEEASAFQNMMLGLDELQGEGINGTGISVAVMDGGFIGVSSITYFDHLFSNGQIRQTYDFVGGGEDVFRYTDHGTQVLSLMAGFKQDEFVGGAIGAGYYLYVTEDDCPTCEYRIEEYNWVFAAEKADSAGVDVINASLGYNLFEDPVMDYTYGDLDGSTAVTSRGASIAASKGIVVVVAAGNEGNLPWKYITAPADAHGILSVGWVNSSGQRSSSSSIGPSADGRIKPEVVALGSGVKVVNGSGSIVSSSGTSFSAPQVSSLVASLWQGNRTLSAEELIFVIKQSASNAISPDNKIGYGLPNAKAVIDLISVLESGQQFTVYPNPLTTGVLVIRSNDPTKNPNLRVTLYSSGGKIVFVTEMSFTGSRLTQALDLTTYPSGLYILNIESGASLEKIRVVKPN